MASKSTITVKILGDNKDLKRALGGAGADVESFGSKAGKALKVGALAATALGGAAVIAIPKLLDAGAEIEAVGVKSATVFGDSLADIETWADGVAGSMGLTNTELIGAAAGFGDLLKPMGFTADEAADMSTEMLDLSGALAAWSGGQVDATGAADVLAKAMLGERDGLKALGISITEADVSGRLLKNGQEDLTGAALQQAKALATQELILEKSADAQTAWTDGSFDGIKAQNESKAAIENVKDAFVMGLYPALQQVVPVITSVATWMGENLPAAFDGASAAVEWVRTNFDQLIPALVGVGAVAGVAFTAWAISAGAAAVATIAAAAPVIALGVVIAALAAGLTWAYKNVDWFREAVDKARALVAGGFKVALEAGKKAVDATWSAVKTASEWLQTTWTKTENLRSLMAAGFTIALGVAKTAVDAIWSAVQTASSWIQTAWDKSETLRSLYAGAFKLAIDGVKTSFDNAKDSVEFIADWLQIAWDKSDTLRSLFVGSFKTSIDNIKTGFEFAKSAAETLASAIQKVIDNAGRAVSAIQKIPGVPGGGGFDIPGLPFFHSGGFIGNPSGPARDIPIMAQQGEYVLSRDDVASLSGGRGGPAVQIGEVHMHNGTDVNALSASLVLAMAA